MKPEEGNQCGTERHRLASGVTAEKQLKIWVCSLCDTHPRLEAQRTLLTTCSLTKTLHKHRSACGFQPGVLHRWLQQEQDSTGAPCPGSPGTPARLNRLLLVSRPSKQGCREGEPAAGRAAEPFSPHLAALVPLHGRGWLRPRGALPAIAAAPSHRFAQGSFACHIPVASLV